MMEKKLELKEIVLIGRTFDEYYRMFELSNINFKDEKILDVASGVSSFCSEANSKGYSVTASDKIYHFSAKEIEEKCISDLKMVMEKLRNCVRAAFDRILSRGVASTTMHMCTHQQRQRLYRLMTGK